MDSAGMQRTIGKFIELYGDRTGKMGDGIHGGFAWVRDAKFVLLASRGTDVGNAADWRRLSRLVGLAGHLHRPLLLWDLPLQIAASKLEPDALVINEAIQSGKLMLLKVGLPIISVFERRFPVLLQSELALVEGAVIVSDNPAIIPSMGNPLSPIAAVKSGTHDLSKTILALLDRASQIGAEHLERRRIERSRTITMQSD